MAVGGEIKNQKPCLGVLIHNPSSDIFLKRIFLTATEFSFSIVLSLSHPTRVTPPSLEVVMKCACLKFLDFGLSKGFGLRRGG